VSASAPRRRAAPTLPELLVALHSRRETGFLEIRAAGVCVRILVRDGSPVFAEGGALRDTLGRMLLRHGALSETDYVRVIERMTERLIDNEATRMGEVLVELGLLTPAEVFDALSVQVVEKIVGCFRWPEFEAAFEPASELPEDVLAYHCPPVEALVLAGVRAHFGPDRLGPLLGPHLGRPARVPGDATEVAARFAMTPAEARLLRGLDGRRPLAEVQAYSPLDPVHTGQVLAALVVSGALEDEPAEAPAPRPRPPRSGAPRPAEVASRPAPAPETRTPVAPFLVGRSLARLRRGIARAERPPTAPPRDHQAARLEAERQYRQGMQLLAQAALPGALRAFGRACELSPGEPEYELLHAWTECLAERDEAARGAARARAAAAARRVLERDREAARAHSILGQIAVASGELEGAERHFRAALRVAPADRDAQRGMRLLERRRAAGGPGGRRLRPERRG
jgi:hypothetical protein